MYKDQVQKQHKEFIELYYMQHHGSQKTAVTYLLLVCSIFGFSH